MLPSFLFLHSSTISYGIAQTRPFNRALKLTLTTGTRRDRDSNPGTHGCKLSALAPGYRHISFSFFFNGLPKTEACWSGRSEDRWEELVLTAGACRSVDSNPDSHGRKPGAFNDWVIPLYPLTYYLFSWSVSHTSPIGLACLIVASEPCPDLDCSDHPTCPAGAGKRIDPNTGCPTCECSGYWLFMLHTIIIILYTWGRAYWFSPLLTYLESANHRVILPPLWSLQSYVGLELFGHITIVSRWPGSSECFRW